MEVNQITPINQDAMTVYKGLNIQTYLWGSQHVKASHTHSLSLSLSLSLFLSLSQESFLVE